MGNAYRSTLAETVTPILPTGNAQPADVLLDKTFSNADGTDKVGTMPNNGTVNPNALAPNGSYTIPRGYHSGSGIVKASPNTETYTPTSRAASLDMGISNLNRYVNTNSVPNTNSGTYTFPENDTGGTKDLGETNTYRHVNATNVYNKGKADGGISVVSVGKYHQFFYMSSSLHKINQSFTNQIDTGNGMGYTTLLINVSNKNSVTVSRIGSGENYFGCYLLKKDGTISSFYGNDTTSINLSGWDYMWAATYSPTTAYQRLAFS